MDQVTLDDKVYEKSAVVAKRFGYTTDYIGQLSRADKIDAQLVGRSWYVYSPSIEEYQETLYDDSEEEVVQKKDKEQTDQSARRANVDWKSSPSRSGEAIVEPRSLPQKPSTPTKVDPGRTTQKPTPTPSPNWHRISYESDSGELLPQLDKKAIDINVFDQKKPTQKAPQSGLRIHCQSPQFSIADTIETKPNERRHRTVAVEQMRMSRSVPDWGASTDEDSVTLESFSFFAENPRNRRSRPFTIFTIAALALLYSVLFVALLSVRTVTYEASSGSFLYTFEIASVAAFMEAL